MLISFTYANPKDWQFIKEIYQEAFPLIERLPLKLLKVTTKKNAKMLVIKNNNINIGFFYYLEYNNYIYVLFYALHKDYRNQGLGTQAIKEFINHFKDYNILLGIEPIDKRADNYTQRVNRKKFYQHVGFKETHKYIRENVSIYEMLSINKVITNNDFKPMIDEWLIKPLSIIFNSYILEE